jgi:hypothetical protein
MIKPSKPMGINPIPMRSGSKISQFCGSASLQIRPAITDTIPAEISIKLTVFKYFILTY